MWSMCCVLVGRLSHSMRPFEIFFAQMCDPQSPVLEKSHDVFYMHFVLQISDFFGGGSRGQSSFGSSFGLALGGHLLVSWDTGASSCVCLVRCWWWPLPFFVAMPLPAFWIAPLTHDSPTGEALPPNRMMPIHLPLGVPGLHWHWLLQPPQSRPRPSNRRQRATTVWSGGTTGGGHGHGHHQLPRQHSGWCRGEFEEWSIRNHLLRGVREARHQEHSAWQGTLFEPWRKSRNSSLERPCALWGQTLSLPTSHWIVPSRMLDWSQKNMRIMNVVPQSLVKVEHLSLISPNLVALWQTRWRDGPVKSALTVVTRHHGLHSVCSLVLSFQVAGVPPSRFLRPVPLELIALELGWSRSS